MKYEGIYSIRADEVTPDKKMSVPAMIKLMQEGSMQNSLEHHFSVWDMEEDEISWVLLRKKLVINKYPTLSDQVKIVTYPITTERILAYRDYKMYNEKGILLAWASSTWTVFNLKTRKLQRIPEKFKDMVAPTDEDILDPPESKINKPKHLEFAKIFTPNFYDTDWNDHVNNVYFIKSMIESTPLDILKSKKIKELTYHIRSESLLGDTLEVSGQKEENQTLIYQMKNCKTEKIIAFSKILWED